MPCACKNPPINVPDNVEWGPVLWTLLHGLAERVGKVPMPGLRGDEMRAWKALLLTLEKVIPCEDCRSHVKSYVAANPVNIPDNYQDARNWIRRWLWTLHEEVNSRLHHNSFPYETLDLVYGGVDFKTVYGILNVLIERAIRGTAVGQLSWNNWNKYVKRLFGMYN